MPQHLETAAGKSKTAGSRKGAGWNAPFLVLFVSANLSIGVVESVLLHIKHDYFKGGFLASNVLNTAALKILFALSSIALDSALILFLSRRPDS